MFQFCAHFFRWPLKWNAVALLLLCTPSLDASSRCDQFSVYGGAFDFMRTRHRAFELGLEYKFYPNWRAPLDFLNFRPLLGIMANMEMSTYLYGGINFDLFLVRHLVISPGFAAGWYNQCDGKNLGFPIEFRSGIELMWQWDDCTRIGFHFYHLSNAGLGSRNPGSESIVLQYDIPIKDRLCLY